MGWHCCLAWKHLTKRKQWRVSGKEVHLFYLDKFWFSSNSPSQKCWPKESDMKSVITGSESKRSITGHWFTKCLTSKGAFLCTKLEKQVLTAMGKWMLHISRNWCLKALCRTTVCVSCVDGSCCLWLKQEENLPNRYWVDSKKVVLLEGWGSKWCKTATVTFMELFEAYRPKDKVFRVGPLAATAWPWSHLFTTLYVWV